MAHNLDHTVSLLTRTPAALDALLRDLPEAWTFQNEGENTWSAFDVVGHLIHGERTDWMARARMILQFGETRAFEPFDRWGQIRESEGKSLGHLLDEFARLRRENLAELRAIESAARGPRAARTPSGPRCRYLVGAAGHVGSSRLDASAPNLKNHGPPIPRGRGSVERIPWRAAVRRPQCSLMNPPRHAELG